jgi:4a-hydroxytetrahydrobiopterin dehydratase
MTELASRSCEPCKSGVPPLTPAELAPLAEQLHEDWQVVDDHHLHRRFRFKNFAEALVYVNRVGDMAEEQFHHPDIALAWGRVDVEIWTHKINGLHEADFVFAAKCDQLTSTS